MKEFNNHTFTVSPEESVRDCMKKLNLQLDRLDVLEAARIRAEIMRLISTLAKTMNLDKRI